MRLKKIATPEPSPAANDQFHTLVAAPLVENGIIDTRCHHHYQGGCNILIAVDETLNGNGYED